MDVTSTHVELTVPSIRSGLRGLPPAEGYALHVKALRYRSRPRLGAWTEFDAKRITIQIPEPFLPFGEVVPYAAKRLPARGLRFAWISEGITFRTRREVLRFLYCHEWYHWYLHEILGRKGAAETACDRFALWNYRKALVTMDDARAALRPPRPAQGATGSP